MKVKILNRSFWQRLFGIPATAPPQDPSCWSYADGKLEIDLDKAGELRAQDGGLRCEGGDLPKRVLVVAGEDGTYRAFHNRCTHSGHRRLDPVPGTGTVQCCSIGKSTFDDQGKRVHGLATEAIEALPVSRSENTLIVSVGS